MKFQRILPFLLVTIAVTIFIGFPLTYLPQFILGYLGMPRRYHAYTQAYAVPTCTPQNYGAKADGITPDTRAIQQAIDSCFTKGGTVEISAGKYLSAPLTLRSHTHIHLASGATLLGSTVIDDYPARTEPGMQWRRTALLHSDNATDISITGQGTIDGQGKIWWDKAEQTRIAGDTSGFAGFIRPLLIDMVKSDHIVFDGPTIINSPMYNITLFQCEHVVIRNIIIKNPGRGAPNTDGIDPFSSSHILIENATIDTGDDNIAIKSGLVERGESLIPSTDITIRNSHFFHGHGLSIGSELAGGAQHIIADHITFDNTDQGIRIKSNRTRGNDIGDFHYSNMTMKNVTTPILITEYYPRIPETDTAQLVDAHTPRFHDITITNVTATGATTAMQIAGVPEHPIQNLTLTNVHLSGRRGAIIQQANITMKNVTVTPEQGEAFTMRQGVNLKR